MSANSIAIGLKNYEYVGPKRPHNFTRLLICNITVTNITSSYLSLDFSYFSFTLNICRKALNLIHYLLHENNSDCSIVTELGFPRMMVHLASSEDAEVREAALRCLLELVQEKANGIHSSLHGEDMKIKQVLEDRIKDIALMSTEDLGAAKEERMLVDSLWNACYSEPSSLREKGLLVMTGEDGPPPDVASKHFEPPLRAWAADKSSKTEKKEKKETPLLLGLCPAPETDNSIQTSSSAGASAKNSNPPHNQ